MRLEQNFHKQAFINFFIPIYLFILILFLVSAVVIQFVYVTKAPLFYFNFDKNSVVYYLYDNEKKHLNYDLQKYAYNLENYLNDLNATFDFSPAPSKITKNDSQLTVSDNQVLWQWQNPINNKMVIELDKNIDNVSGVPTLKNYLKQRNLMKFIPAMNEKIQKIQTFTNNFLPTKSSVDNQPTPFDGIKGLYLTQVNTVDPRVLGITYNPGYQSLFKKLEFNDTFESTTSELSPADLRLEFFITYNFFNYQGDDPRFKGLDKESVAKLSTLQENQFNIGWSSTDSWAHTLAHELGHAVDGYLSTKNKSEYFPDKSATNFDWWDTNINEARSDINPFTDHLEIITGGEKKLINLLNQKLVEKKPSLGFLPANSQFTYSMINNEKLNLALFEIMWSQYSKDSFFLPNAIPGYQPVGQLAEWFAENYAYWTIWGAIKCNESNDKFKDLPDKNRYNLIGASFQDLIKNEVPASYTNSTIT